MLKKYYIYYRDAASDLMMTTIILGANATDACRRARKNNILGEASNGFYYVNQGGTMEKNRRHSFVKVPAANVFNTN